MMFPLNENERALQKELQKDVEIPSVVLDKARDAYRAIESRQVSQSKAAGNSFRWMRTTAKAAGAAAAVLAAGFVLCAANPVMARELPLVGGLFAQLQDHVSFFGNFADKATKLEDPAAEASPDTAGQADFTAANASGSSDADTSGGSGTDASGTGASGGSDTDASSSSDTDASGGSDTDASGGSYTKTADGLTITFSEVYANSQAIYLAMTAKSETPFPETMMMQTEDGTTRPLFTLDAAIRYSFWDSSKSVDAYGGNHLSMNPEGMFLDENTYACILRLDLAAATQDSSEYSQQYESMTNQVLNEMGITLDDLNDQTEEGYALLEQYIDEISARGGALRSYIKEVPLPDTFDVHIDINRFTGDKADPEYWDSGYSEEELSAMSDEEWRAVMQQEPAEYRTYPNEHQNYWFDGPWSFDIPITVDNSQTVTLELNETNSDGIGLKSVVKTPYELTVYELYEEGSDSDTFMVALDANGNKLPYNDSTADCNNFAIQDRDISTVDIYILDYVQYMDELKGPERYNNNETKPQEEKWSTLLDANAKYHKTIHFDEAQ